MALAKYREDIEEEYYENTDKKNWDSIWGSNRIKRFDAPIEETSVDEEFNEVKTRLMQIESWIRFDKAISNIIISSNIINQINLQLNHLNIVKDGLLNKFYNPKFNAVRKDYCISNNEAMQSFYEILKIDFLKYLLDQGAQLRNINNSDSIGLNQFFGDLEAYSKQMFSIDKNNIDTVLIMHIRENILMQRNLRTVLCERCGEKTYEDFHVCVFCNNDRGGI